MCFIHIHCNSNMLSFNLALGWNTYFLYPRHMKYVGVYSFPFSVRSFVRKFVRTFARSFVFPSQGQSFCVKVYKTSYFEDPLMDFIHILHGDRYRSKVFISTIPTPGVTLGSRSRTSNFHKKVRVKVFALKFIRPHILKTLWWISFIFGMMVDI